MIRKCHFDAHKSIWCVLVSKKLQRKRRQDKCWERKKELLLHDLQLAPRIFGKQLNELSRHFLSMPFCCRMLTFLAVSLSSRNDLLHSFCLLKLGKQEASKFEEMCINAKIWLEKLALICADQSILCKIRTASSRNFSTTIKHSQNVSRVLMTFSAHLFPSENICKQCKELPTDVQLQISLETYHSSINCKQAKKSVFMCSHSLASGNWASWVRPKIL